MRWTALSGWMCTAAFATLLGIFVGLMLLDFVARHLFDDDEPIDPEQRGFEPVQRRSRDDEPRT